MNQIESKFDKTVNICFFAAFCLILIACIYGIATGRTGQIVTAIASVIGLIVSYPFKHDKPSN